MIELVARDAANLEKLGNRHRRRHEHQAWRQSLHCAERRAKRALEANRHVCHGLCDEGVYPTTKGTPRLRHTTPFQTSY
jgi:hypothetical protein